MDRFLAQHRDRIVGVLSGYDRVLFRGTLPSLCSLRSLENFLLHYRLRYKDFGEFARRCSEEIAAHGRAYAQQHGRPYLHLQRETTGKDDLARRLAQRDSICSGLIAVFGCVEACHSYRVQGNRAQRTIHIVPAPRQGLHLYFYFQHPEFGLLHVRVQTWLPFAIQVCINGRAYLAQQMTKAGIAFTRRDNCFTHLADVARAQTLLDQLTHFDWTTFLNDLIRPLQPLLDDRYGLDQHGYYWTMHQSEYATDLLFRDATSLRALYPALVAHAYQQFQAPDVLRFLGKRPQPLSQSAEVASEVCRRPEGVRVKHRVGGNAVKMYDKQGCVLRVETTINDAPKFQVRRFFDRHGEGRWRNMPLRKGVVDAWRRVELCQAINGRYLDALAVVHQPQPVAATLDPVSRPIAQEGRRYRPLRPLTPEDSAWFRVVLRGEHVVHGFRNADLRNRLLPKACTPTEQRRASARITRWLRLLRAHRLVRKVPGSQRYRVTHRGHHLMTLALSLRKLDLTTLAA
jgi:hypothetical protein